MIRNEQIKGIQMGKRAKRVRMGRGKRREGRKRRKIEAKGKETKRKKVSP